MSTRPRNDRDLPARRITVVGILGLALIGLIVLIPRPGGDGPGPAPSNDSAEETPSSPITRAPGEPIDPDTALAAVEAAADSLLAEPYVRVEARSDLDGLVETFSIGIDLAERSFTSWETVGSDVAVEATIEQIETPTTIYIRVVGDPPSIHRWSVIPVEVPEQLQFDRTYTLFGRITPALGELIPMWRAIRPQAERLEADGAVGYRFTARADDVSRYLRDENLAGVGPTDEIGASIWELWIDDEGLRRLVGNGVQFFDGEAFRNANIDIEFRLEPVSVDLPDL